MLFRRVIVGVLAWAFASPAFAATYDLVIDRTDVQIEGQTRRVFSINGQIAGPTLRWTEGEEVTVNVINHLKEETSIHWHGVLVPYRMDGVPMLRRRRARHDLHLPLQGSPVRHLLVPQPFRRPGAGGHVCPHRHRAGER
jgi:hypothetical protein